MGQQYDVGEKPIVILYTCIDRHVRTPNKTKTKDMTSLDYSSIYFDERNLQLVDRCEGPQNYNRPVEIDIHLFMKAGVWGLS